MKAENKLVVIVGETGSGKSAAALELANRLNGEIICADSWTVYKGFDIGTAKPTTEERRQVKHHLLDIADPRDGFNAALFKKVAEQAITNIQSRGKLPILVGGTGLYIDSVLFNYGFLPTVSQEERALRNNESLPELLIEAKTEGVDLAGIDIRNKRRVIRALEAKGQRPRSTSMRPNTLILGIQTERDDLRERIIKRVDKMLSQGFKKEVDSLAKKYGWGVEPMKGIGYREWRNYFEGSKDLAQTRELIISGTMNLAKKQRTWFKRNKRIQWINNPNKIVEIATTKLNKLD